MVHIITIYFVDKLIIDTKIVLENNNYSTSLTMLHNT